MAFALAVAGWRMASALVVGVNQVRIRHPGRFSMLENYIHGSICYPASCFCVRMLSPAARDRDASRWSIEISREYVCSNAYTGPVQLPALGFCSLRNPAYAVLEHSLHPQHPQSLVHASLGADPSLGSIFVTLRGQVHGQSLCTGLPKALSAAVH
jgi:hypothetical protein